MVFHVILLVNCMLGCDFTAGWLVFCRGFLPFNPRGILGSIPKICWVVPCGALVCEGQASTIAARQLGFMVFYGKRYQ